MYLKRLLRNNAKLHFQNLADKFASELKQIEMKEAPGVKIRAKIIWELEGKKCNKYFFQKLEKRKNACQDILALKTR